MPPQLKIACLLVELKVFDFMTVFEVTQEGQRHVFWSEKSAGELDDLVASDGADVLADLVGCDRVPKVKLIAGDVAHP
jgi:hypothetical protein